MGEAKRKKAASGQTVAPKPESHETPKTASEVRRGLVVSPPVEVIGDLLRLKSSWIDPQELRCATLLWDKIVWPSSRAMHLASGPDEVFLERVGFLERPDYTVNGDVAQALAYGQIAAFNDLDRKQPGVWSLAQGENSLLIRGGAIIRAGNAQLRLTNAIPVPNRDVPLAEVLEFKLRRRDELKFLRDEIDTLLENIDKTGGEKGEIQKLVAKIDEACANAIKVGREWQYPVRLTNFKTTYKVRPFQTLAGAITGALGSQTIQMASVHAALASFAGAMIATASAFEITFDGFEWRGLRPRPGPYRYVYDFHNELF